MATLLVIDNFDSFTYNLVQMFTQDELEIRVFRNNALNLDGVDRMVPDYIIISPGPKNPGEAGISKDLIATFYKKIPILGVCLGMQCINEVFGGTTIKAPIPMHGKTSAIHHEKGGLLAGIPSPFTAARYHSLVIQPPWNNPLEITARSEDGVIMGISHPEYPLHGLQFHPESFLTEYGFALIENFLNLKIRD